jgi:hypothetical protein
VFEYKPKIRLYFRTYIDRLRAALASDDVGDDPWVAVLFQLCRFLGLNVHTTKKKKKSETGRFQCRHWAAVVLRRTSIVAKLSADCAPRSPVMTFRFHLRGDLV